MSFTLRFSSVAASFSRGSHPVGAVKVGAESVSRLQVVMGGSALSADKYLVMAEYPITSRRRMESQGLQGQNCLNAVD